MSWRESINVSQNTKGKCVKGKYVKKHKLTKSGIAIEEEEEKLQ